jgi:hypothetical protein
MSTENRILVYHAESDCYFVCKSKKEFHEWLGQDDLNEVTGIDYHELEYKNRLKADLKLKIDIAGGSNGTGF